ncbi:MAG: hypothetical protein AABY11_03190, partial [archaeon]
SVPLLFDGSLDPDSHFHARLSNEIARSGVVPVWDALSLQGRVYSYPPLLHVLTGLLSRVTGLDSLLVLKGLGIFIGGLLSITTFLLARSVSNSTSIGLWSALFASVCAIAVWRTAGFTRPDGVALMLIPLALYLWHTRRDALAFVLSIAMVFLHPLSAVVFALLLGTFFLLGLVQKQRVSFWIPVSLGGMLVSFFAWVHSIGLPLSQYASPLSLQATELTRFWVLGFVVYFPLSWMFSAYGLVKARLPLVVWGWVFLTVVIAAFGTRLAMYSIPFLAIVAAYGVVSLLQFFRTQRIFVPALTVFVLFIGCVTVYYLMNSQSPYITPSEHNVVGFLSQHAQSGESVLTPWDQGHVVAYYTLLPVVIDGYFEFAHELDARNNASYDALATSSCETWTRSMDAFDARYFYLPHDELNGFNVKHGLLELEPCPEMRLLYSSTDARLYERV